MIKKKKQIGEQEIYLNHLGSEQLKNTRQRQLILDAFLKTEQHLTAEEFYEVLRKKHPELGQATVYRTLKLLVGAGLAREVYLSDGITRFEHHFAHPHHDHLVCLSCGNLIEFYHPEIEALQEKIVKQYQFQAEQHKLEIYGYCLKCKKQIRIPKFIC